jgi:fructose-bisphosphate aldolase class II
MSKMGMTLEIELGITGGEEDGVDNSDVDSSKLYSTRRSFLCLRRTF